MLARTHMQRPSRRLRWQPHSASPFICKCGPGGLQRNRSSLTLACWGAAHLSCSAFAMQDDLRGMAELVRSLASVLGGEGCQQSIEMAEKMQPHADLYAMMQRGSTCLLDCMGGACRARDCCEDDNKRGACRDAGVGVEAIC